MEISTITIVLNEEEILDKWFNHHKDLFEEIEVVIVDGGSTDRTVDKIKSYGIEPYFREWDHNFSAQRNFAIDKSKNDWCLVLDVDLFLSKEFMKTLPQIISNVDVPVLMSYRYNYIDGEIFEPCFEELHFRMFKKSCGVRYVKEVHEYLQLPPNTKYGILDKRFYATHDKSFVRAKKRWYYYRDQFGSDDTKWIDKLKK